MVIILRRIWKGFDKNCFIEKVIIYIRSRNGSYI